MAMNAYKVVRTEEQSAFFHSYEYVRGQKLGIIKLNLVIAEKLVKDDISPAALHPRHLPMLMKPKPWVAHNNGGYLYSKSKPFFS
jgi:DNA-directed RNA polymerase